MVVRGADMQSSVTGGNDAYVHYADVHGEHDAADAADAARADPAADVYDADAIAVCVYVDVCVAVPDVIYVAAVHSQAMHVDVAVAVCDDVEL